MAEEEINSPEKDSEELHNWCTGLLDDGLSARRPFEGQWWQNIATFMGDFWTDWDPHINRLVEPDRADYKVRLPINLAQPVVRTELAKLIKNRPITNIIAPDNDRESLSAAEVGDFVVNNWAEQYFHLAKKRRRMLHWVLMCGLGGLFVDWDETARSPVEMYVTPRGEPLTDPKVVEGYKHMFKRRGEKPPTKTFQMPDLVIKELSPFQIIWDLSQIYFEDATWMIITDVFDVDEIERRWGEQVEPEEEARPGVVERRLIAKMDLTSKLDISKTHTQRLARINRLFIRPGHKFFPDGGHIVFTNDRIIRAENFPYKHGELPASLMGHIPLPTNQFPMSILQHVRGPVTEMSKTESQLIESRNLAANPIWLVPDQLNIEADEIQNRPGLRLEYHFMPNVPQPAPVQMPDMPAYVKELIPLLREHVLEISGQGETSQGRVPPGARSGVAIAYLQEEDDTRLGPTVIEFEECMERSNRLMLETIAEKYEAPRIVRVFRKHGEPEVLEFIGKMVEGLGVQVQAGSALPRSKAAKQQFILDLWDRRLEQDPRKVREMLELATGEPDEWEIDVSQAEREMEKLKNGQPVEVEEWHNHPAHHYVHRNFMKSADFETLPEVTQLLIREHDQEHTRFEAQQQQQMAFLQQAGGPPGGPVPPQEPPFGTPQAAGNGQPVGGPPPQFQPGESPRDLLGSEGEPQ